MRALSQLPPLVVPKATGGASNGGNMMFVSVVFGFSSVCFFGSTDLHMSTKALNTFS
jgi:hypothetical protein